MSSFVGTAHRVYVGPLDLSGLASHVDFGQSSRSMEPCTTFNDGGFNCVKPGMISGSGMVDGYQDYATGVLDDTISIGSMGSQYAMTVIPATGTVAAADPCWFSRGLIGSLNPLDGAKGQMGEFHLGLNFDTTMLRGFVGAPKATVVANTTGTAVAMTGPSATQRLYAWVHVFAYSGFTNVVFTVETDDAVGFPSATTRLTFTTVTGLTSEFASVTGGFATETHARIVATKTGAGSITYAAGFGVL